MPPKTMPQLRRYPLAVLGFALVLGAGCSSRQLYGAGQAWQDTECRKRPPSEQQRCMSSHAMTFEDYQREAAAAKGR